MPFSSEKCSHIFERFKAMLRLIENTKLWRKQLKPNLTGKIDEFRKLPRQKSLPTDLRWTRREHLKPLVRLEPCHAFLDLKFLFNILWILLSHLKSDFMNFKNNLIANLKKKKI